MWVIKFIWVIRGRRSKMWFVVNKTLAWKGIFMMHLIIERNAVTGCEHFMITRINSNSTSSFYINPDMANLHDPTKQYFIKNLLNSTESVHHLYFNKQIVKAHVIWTFNEFPKYLGIYIRGLINQPIDAALNRDFQGAQKIVTMLLTSTRLRAKFNVCIWIMCVISWKYIAATLKKIYTKRLRIKPQPKQKQATALKTPRPDHQTYIFIKYVKLNYAQSYKLCLCTNRTRVCQ